MPRRKQPWSYWEGRKGVRVGVYEREPGGPLYARAFDASMNGGKGGYRRLSLGHSDREAAKTYAMEQAAKLRVGRSDLANGKTTLARLFARYTVHHSPRKTSGEQGGDQRRVKMWTRYLGAQKDPHAVTLAEWERFIDLRSSGAILPDGTEAAPDKRQPVRARTVEADLKWLRWVLNWATKWQDEHGRYLLRENAVRGFDIPTEKNPRRPVATKNRFEAVRAKADEVMMEIRWDGQRRVHRSYLAEILDIAEGTGRRISAICALRYQDLVLAAGPNAPHGSIRWPAETDKEGFETVAPLSPSVRAAIDRVLRERPGIGARYLFPSAVTPDKPVSSDRAGQWLREAEALAKVPKQAGGLWHPYRRAWATARKHLPLKDVAAAGGWRCTETLLRCYQQADDETMLKVVMGGVELREKKA